MSAGSPLRVAVVGAHGRMGRLATELLTGRSGEQRGLELVGEIVRGDDLVARLTESRADVAVDFTAAGLGLRHGKAMLGCGVRPLIGTSGVDAQETARLDTLAREAELGGLVVPNFSVGIWLQQALALEARKHLGSVEIIEEHHEHKRDAPSGTAVDTAERFAAAGHPDPVPIHSVRLAGLYSNQTILFGGPGEVLRITHETYGVEAFGPGILAGLAYAATATGVQRGIGHALA